MSSVGESLGKLELLYTADGTIKWYNHFEKTVWQFLSLYFFFIRLIFLRAVLDLQQNWEEGTEIFHWLPLPPHRWPPSLLVSSVRAVHLWQSMNLRQHVIIIQSPQFTLEFTLGGVHSMGVDKWWHGHHYNISILQSIFTALKILQVLPVHQLLVTMDLFIVFIALHFPECHILGSHKV